MPAQDSPENAETGSESEASPPSLWRNTNYRIFLAVQTFSALGDSFSYVAIPLLVLHSTGSVVQMGLITALTGVASIITGIFAGVVADRFDRKRLLMLCDGARCLLYAFIPLVWIFATPTWLLFTVVPIGGVFAMLFQVTYVTVTPAIVETDQITKANGHLYASYAIVSVAGPALAGLVAAVFGPAAAIGLDAVTFAVSAAGLLLVKVPAARREDPADGEHGGVRGEFLAGARFLYAHPVLRPLTVLLSLLTFLTYGLTDVVIYRLKHDLGHQDTVVGYVLAAGTVGSFVAASTVALLRKRIGFSASWIGGFSLAGVAVASLGLSRSVPVIAVGMAVMLLCTGIAGISSMSLRQEVTPSHLLGRVTASFWTIHSALGPLGAAVITAAAANFGVAVVCLTVGITVLIIALSGTVTGLGQAGAGRLADETA